MKIRKETLPKIGLTLLLIAAIVTLALTVNRWLPRLLAFVDLNSDRLQALESLVQLALLVLGGVIAYFGLWRRRNEQTQITTRQATVTTSSGDVIIVADPTHLAWIKDAGQRTPDLLAASEQYLAHLVTLYRYLDIKGMGVTDRVALRLPLIDLYVPLKARIQMPEGDTWTRTLRLAGRTPSDKEMEVIGQRVSEPLQLLDLLKEHDGLIILGDPGAGKTTFLKYLTLKLAAGEGKASGLKQTLPIIAPLSAFAKANEKNNVALERFLADYHVERGVSLPIQPLFAEALKRGQALVMLDGLDEIKDPVLRKHVVDQVLVFYAVQRQRGNKFLLTSRIVGYAEVRPTAEKLGECTVVDFEDEDIVQFVDQWTQVIEQLAREQSAAADVIAGEERRELLDAVQYNAGVRRLAANPLLLTVLALMKRQGVVLPERRVQLYDQAVNLLLLSWNRARGLGRPPEYTPDVEQLLPILAELALWMHANNPEEGLAQERDLRAKLEEIHRLRMVADPAAATEHFLTDVRDYGNLLLARGANEYGFIHLTFQEYLAAMGVAQKGHTQVEPVVDELASHLGQSTWREVSLLAIGYIGVIQRRQPAAGDALLLLAESTQGEAGAGAVLAGQALVDVWPAGVTPACKTALVEKLNATMTGRSVRAPLRLQAWLALADLGEEPPGLDDFMPIPGLPGVRIGKYPVTNAQFRRFYDAGGYATRKWWSDKGWEYKQRFRWTESRLWDNEQFNRRTQPVVGVSWYEAEAYCNWLSATRAYGVIGADECVRLPNEEQWLQAARNGQPAPADARLDFPWRGPFEPWRANTEENKGNDLGQTSPVHMYAGGCTPDGVWDMLGNVWEWTSTIDRIDSDGDPWYIVRGGSWYFSGASGLAGLRSADIHRGRWDDGRGFRAVVVPILSCAPSGC